MAIRRKGSVNGVRLHVMTKAFGETSAAEDLADVGGATHVELSGQPRHGDIRRLASTAEE
jgi:hypothetical protein